MAATNQLFSLSVGVIEHDTFIYNLKFTEKQNVSGSAEGEAG